MRLYEDAKKADGLAREAKKKAKAVESAGKAVQRNKVKAAKAAERKVATSLRRAAEKEVKKLIF